MRFVHTREQAMLCAPLPHVFCRPPCLSLCLPTPPADEDDEAETAQLHVRKVAHTGGINRVRAMPQQPHILATWADTAQVQVWDLSAQLAELRDEAAPVPGAQGKIHKVNARHVHTHSSGAGAAGAGAEAGAAGRWWLAVCALPADVSCSRCCPEPAAIYLFLCVCVYCRGLRAGLVAGGDWPPGVWRLPQQDSRVGAHAGGQVGGGAGLQVSVHRRRLLCGRCAALLRNVVCLEGSWQAVGRLLPSGQGGAHVPTPPCPALPRVCLPACLPKQGARGVSGGHTVEPHRGHCLCLGICGQDHPHLGHAGAGAAWSGCLAGWLAWMAD